MKMFGAWAAAAVLVSAAGMACAEVNSLADAQGIVVVSQDSVTSEKQALAARVVRLTTADMEKQILDYMGSMFSQMDAEGADRTVAVWFEKNAGPVMLPHIRTFMGEVEQMYARLLTVEELQAMITFYETPMGRSIARKQTQLGIDMSGPIEAMTVNYAQDLMTRFCNDHDCSDSEGNQPAASRKSTRR